MDGGVRWVTVHGVAKSPTGLSDFTFTGGQGQMISLRAEQAL